MQWGSANVDQFATSIKSQGAKTILVRTGNLCVAKILNFEKAFNEPDSSNEANIQAKEAASLWMQFLEPMKASGVRLGGPAVTAPGTGIPWLIDFFSNCTSCSVDFIPLHW
jgi:glycine/serine hydroxymethyltransferase